MVGVWLTPLPRASLRMLSLSFRANVDLAEVLKACVIILFSTPSWSLSFQSKITPGEALINRLAECDGCTVSCKSERLNFFACLITSETFLCFLINSLLCKTNTALEKHLIAPVLGYMSNLMNISKSHFSSR